MLAKKQRLSRTEFAHVLKYGRRFHGDALSLVVSPAPSMKCGVVVSKKVARLATARNTLRRAVYKVLGEHTAMLQNKHVVVLTRKGAAGYTASALEAEIHTLLEKTAPAHTPRQ